MTTIKEVAEHLGVAASSVSRVLNDHPDVSDDMRRRVESAIAELGYQPDYLAQSLRRGATRSVGFLLRDLSNPIFADIVKGAEIRLREDGYSVLLLNSEGDPALDRANLEVLRRRRVDGLLISLQSETDPEAGEALRATEVPIVLIDREVEGVEASIVRCDHRSGVRSATQHLRALGHERIGFLSGPRDILATRERVAGFRDAMGDQQDGDEGLVRLGSYSREFGYEQTIQLLTSVPRPTAIISAGLQSTTGVLAAITQLSLEVGRDVALVSCDETELMQFVSPPISAVRRDALRIGRLAAELLLERLADPAAAPRDVVVPTHYVPRGSSAPPSDG